MQYRFVHRPCPPGCGCRAHIDDPDGTQLIRIDHDIYGRETLLGYVRDFAASTNPPGPVVVTMYPGRPEGGRFGPQERVVVDPTIPEEE